MTLARLQNRGLLQLREQVKLALPLNLPLLAAPPRRLCGGCRAAVRVIAVTTGTVQHRLGSVVTRYTHDTA